MKKIKKLTAVIMTIVMLLTVMPLAGIDFTKASALDGEGSYDLPSATLTATPVIRTAAKTDDHGDYLVGNQIVMATPSGVPYTTGKYANEAYSGETPEWPSVTFECDRSLAADKDSVTLRTNISDAQIEVSNPTDSKWVWTIKGGTIDAGTFADFTVSYTYTYTDSLTGKTITKDYKAYASSYVDNVIQPAGMYISSDRKWAFHSNNKCEAVVRILGQNTKGSYYPAGEDMGSSEWAHGVYDFQTRQAIGWGNTAAAYPNGGTVLYQSEKKDAGNITTNTLLDRQRPVSSTYIDTSKNTALNSSDINLRYSVYFFGEHSEEYNAYLNGIVCLDGEKSYEAFNPEDAAAAQELDFALKNGDVTYASTCEGKSEPTVYNTSNEFAVFNSANSGKVLALNIPFRGTDYANSANLETLADGNKLVKYTFVNAPAQRYYATNGGQILAIHNAVNLNLYLYNKAELRSAIEAAGDVIGAEWFYDNTDGSYDTYLAALTDALHINAKYDTNQNDIDAAADALNAAIEALVAVTVEFADYAAVYSAIEYANGLNPNDYTDESWANLMDAINAIVYDLDSSHQDEVDAMAYQICEAIDALDTYMYIPELDFSEIDELLNEIAGLDENDYTPESWANLERAIDAFEALDTGSITQPVIDDAAAALRAAIDALNVAYADYTEVLSAIEQADSYNSENYTAESWADLTEAINAVVYDLDITHQDEVDAMAAAINDAIDGLVAYADYTELLSAVNRANYYNAEDFTEESWAAVEAALAAVVYKLDYTHQDEVDAMADRINAAVDGLVCKIISGEGSYILSSATLTATPVIRTAGKMSGYGNYIAGDTIVQATPSGVPYTTGKYANEAYSGETPEWPTVTFECDQSLLKDKNSVRLETNISGAQIEVSNPTSRKWVWTIKGGTIQPGTFADFTVSYSYTYTDSLTGKTETKNYKVYASSYVDNVLQPAGMYISSDRKWAFHSNNKCEAVVRILGQNTKGSYYPAGEDMGTYEWAHGVYDFQVGGSNGALGWNNTATAYPNGGTVLYESGKKTDGHITTNKTLDCQRPVSSTYIDTSMGTALDSENINLRYSAFFFGEHSKEYDAYVCDTTVLSGEQEYSTSNTEDTAAARELVFDLPHLSSSYAYTCAGKEKPVVYNTSNPYAVFNSADSGKVLALNIPFRGTGYASSPNLETLADGNKLVKYTFVNAPAQRYYATNSGQVLAVHNAVNINLYLYNKAELRSAIENAAYNESQIPVSPTGYETGVNPQEWYYDNTDGSYDTFLAALKNALHINAKYDTNQNDIDAAAEALNAATADLKIAAADYTAANEALARYNRLNAEDYTAESWAAVEAAKAALGDMNYTIFYQPLVDDLTAEFVAAMEALVVVAAEPADYTAVFSAIAYANGLNPNDYTDESWANLMDAIHAVEYDLDSTHQDEVDAMATAINEAIDALDTIYYTPEPDFSEINGLLDEIAGLNEHDYTPESWANLERAVDAVMALYIGSITQHVVNDAVAALRAAIDALEKVHTHTLSHVVVPSTCTVQGMEYDICTDCGKTINQTVLPLAEHTWGEWIRTLEPTTQAEGVEERTCCVCGAVETRFIEKLNEIVDEETGVSITYGDEFTQGVELAVAEMFDGTSFQILSADYDGNIDFRMFDITPTFDGEKIQPTGTVTVRIPVPAEFNGTDIFVVYVNSENGTTEDLPCTVVDGYVEFQTTHFSHYAICQFINLVRRVRVSDISLKPDSSKMINPKITADDGVSYTVKYFSYDPSVADVDSDGTVHALKNGKTSIRCIVTDEYGNSESDVCKVTVRTPFIQWIIRIFFFGFLWMK